MMPADLFRFVLWAQQHKDSGMHLQISDVMDRWGISRPQAYRILAQYFDANCWQWPRPRQSLLRIPCGVGIGRTWHEANAA